MYHEDTQNFTLVEDRPNSDDDSYSNSEETQPTQVVRPQSSLDLQPTDEFPNGTSSQSRRGNFNDLGIGRDNVSIQNQRKQTDTSVHDTSTSSASSISKVSHPVPVNSNPTTSSPLILLSKFQKPALKIQPQKGNVDSSMSLESAPPRRKGHFKAASIARKKSTKRDSEGRLIRNNTAVPKATNKDSDIEIDSSDEDFLPKSKTLSAIPSHSTVSTTKTCETRKHNDFFDTIIKKSKNSQERAASKQLLSAENCDYFLFHVDNVGTTTNASNNSISLNGKIERVFLAENSRVNDSRLSHITMLVIPEDLWKASKISLNAEKEKLGAMLASGRHLHGIRELEDFNNKCLKVFKPWELNETSPIVTANGFIKVDNEAPRTTLDFKMRLSSNQNSATSSPYYRRLNEKSEILGYGEKMNFQATVVRVVLRDMVERYVNDGQFIATTCKISGAEPSSILLEGTYNGQLRYFVVTIAPQYLSQIKHIDTLTYGTKVELTDVEFAGEMHEEISSRKVMWRSTISDCKKWLSVIWREETKLVLHREMNPQPNCDRGCLIIAKFLCVHQNRLYYQHYGSHTSEKPQQMQVRDPWLCRMLQSDVINRGDFIMIHNLVKDGDDFVLENFSVIEKIKFFDCKPSDKESIHLKVFWDDQQHDMETFFTADKVPMRLDNAPCISSENDFVTTRRVATRYVVTPLCDSYMHNAEFESVSTMKEKPSENSMVLIVAPVDDVTLEAQNGTRLDGALNVKNMMEVLKSNFGSNVCLSMTVNEFKFSVQLDAQRVFDYVKGWTRKTHVEEKFKEIGNLEIVVIVGKPDPRTDIISARGMLVLLKSTYVEYI